MKTQLSMWLGLALTLSACKRDDAPRGTPAADARTSTSADAPVRVADAASLVFDAAASVDAAGAVDAIAGDAAAPTRDAGGPRPRPRSPVDAAPRTPVDAGPPPIAPDAGVAVVPCHRKRFETKLIADACAEGGLAAAKVAMKKFTKGAKRQERELDCKSCHQKLAPSYPLKDDGLEQFRRLGGE